MLVVGTSTSLLPVLVAIGTRIVRLDHEDTGPARQLRCFLMTTVLMAVAVLTPLSRLLDVVRALVVVVRGARGPGEQKIGVHTGRR